MKTRNDIIYNAHLDGSEFFWESGEIGILLIHGFTATPSEIKPLARVLHKNGYSVSGPLLSGHFTRPEDLNYIRWQDWIDSVFISYEKLKDSCKQVIIGGESMGGLIALYFASQYPEISAVLTYAPALRLNLNQIELTQIKLLSRFNVIIKKRNMEDDDFWQGYLSYPLKGTNQLLKLQTQVRNRLHKITQPLLIVQGRLDPTVHRSVPTLLENETNSKRIEIHWMDQSKHCVLIDKEMDEVNKITLKFLTSVFQ